MFFKVLAAMVTADAFDRHRREQQRRAWMAADTGQTATPGAAPAPVRVVPPATAGTFNLSARERPS